MELFAPNTKITVLGSVIVRQGSLVHFVKDQFVPLTLAVMEGLAWVARLGQDFCVFAL